MRRWNGVTSGDPLDDVRARYAAASVRLAERLGFHTGAVERAFAAVPRERFLVPPPWTIFGPGGRRRETTRDPSRLYADVLVVLDRARGINNGQPALHAAWLAAVAPRPGETAVQIGAGTGYYTAILAALVGPQGRVEAYEIEPALAAIAWANLAPFPQVHVHAASGLDPIPAADVIYAAASLPAPPPEWLAALRPGGRLILPWQPPEGPGRTLLVRRVARGFSAVTLFPVAFIACAGARRQTKAQSRSPADAVRSLHLRRDRAPDATATAILDDVWLSSADP